MSTNVKRATTKGLLPDYHSILTIIFNIIHVLFSKTFLFFFVFPPTWRPNTQFVMCEVTRKWSIPAAFLQLCTSHNIARSHRIDKIFLCLTTNMAVVQIENTTSVTCHERQNSLKPKLNFNRRSGSVPFYRICQRG